MNASIFRNVLAAGVLLISAVAHAEDIDLYVQPSNSNALPNAVFVLDNAAAFSASTDETCKYDDTGASPSLMSNSGNSLTVGAVEQCALVNVLNAIKQKTVADGGAAKMNIGIMVYNGANIRDISNTHCGGSGAQGGCLAIPLTTADAAGLTTIINWIKSWTNDGKAKTGAYIKANSEATAAAIQETWAYYVGKMGLSGRDYSGIKPDASCSNHIIFIGNAVGSNGTPGDGGSNSPQAALEGSASYSAQNASPAATALEKTIITGTWATKSCGTISFPVSNHNTSGFYADEWTRYAFNTAKISTFGIAYVGDSCRPDYPALLRSMVQLEGGNKDSGYFEASNYKTLATSIENALNKVQAVNSVFASVSLPVSVNTQGSYLNQVYIGMFRPDVDALPRWNGNLKQYKIGYADSTKSDLTTLDANSNKAIGDKGFIDKCALSYWTPTSLDTYWQFSPRGECTASGAASRYTSLSSTFTTATDADLTYSNFPDGNIVEKGAQGYKLRATTPSNRNIYTCSTGFATCAVTPALTSFSTSNSALTSSSLLGTLGASSSAEQTALIQWQAGMDTNNENGNDKTTTEIRPSAHGDIVHSRPTAINFGTDSSPKVAVFYGGNDGVLHAINGNRDGGSNIGSVAPGQELWSFVPPEFYGSIKRIKDNTVPVNYKGSSYPGALPKPYGMDGSVTAYSNSSTSAWIYATMRRGGRVVYSFDYDASSSPTTPSMKWKIGCPNNLSSSSPIDDTDCSSGMTGFGQSWSAPKIIKASGYTSGTTPIPLVVTGGGYDPCEDTDDGSRNNSCTSSSKGNHIYVLDADTGIVQKTLDTDRPVIADVAIVPDASTGLAKYGYAADLGGNVYRITIGSAAPADWTITKVASLGCSTPSTPCSANRKFMFAPDIVEESGMYILLLGSGDREKPLASFTAATSVANYFFMIKDKPTDAAWLSSENANCGADLICLASLTPILTSATPSTSTLSTMKGWYLGLRSSEQIVTSAITVFGTITFSSHIPQTTASGSCASELGTASVYNVAYTNASPTRSSDRYAEIAGGGLPPSPIAGTVILDDGTKLPFIIGASPESPLEAMMPLAPSVVTNRPKVRTYWYITQ